MKENQILCAAIIGAGNLDVLARPASPDVFEKRTLPLESIELHPGGDALNEAIVAARLGVKVRLITLLGDDEAGSLLIKKAEKAGVDIYNADASWPTSVNVVLVEENGERCFLTAKDTSMRKLALQHIPDIHEDIVCLASLFVSPELPIEDVIALMKQLKSEGKITCMDTTTAKHGETMEDMAKLLPYVDYFFTNEREAASITHAGSPGESMEKFIHAGANTVLIKMGKTGVLVYHDGRIWLERAKSNPDCIDTTGCGDAFAAGFICGLSRHESFIECLHRGMDCGSVASTCMGAATAFEDPEKLPFPL